MNLGGSNLSHFMALSTHSTSQLEALDIRHYGSPKYNDVAPTTSPCQAASPTPENTLGDEELESLPTIFDVGESLTVTSFVVGAALDAGSGQSGGPM